MLRPILIKIDLKNMELLKALEYHLDRMRDFGRPVEVVVVDSNGQIGAGALEKAVVIWGEGNIMTTLTIHKARDLVVDRYHAGRLFDDDIRELYLISQDHYLLSIGQYRYKL